MENQQNAPTPTQTVVVVARQKSAGVAFILALLFGPLGLLYASVIGGIVMIILGAIIGFITLGFGLVIVWIASIIWSIAAVNSFNKKIAENTYKK
jgi:hypothetical protein